jgi:hypothetical protein
VVEEGKVAKIISEEFAVSLLFHFSSYFIIIVLFLIKTVPPATRFGPEIVHLRELENSVSRVVPAPNRPR